MAQAVTLGKSSYSKLIYIFSEWEKALRKTRKGCLSPTIRQRVQTVAAATRTGKQASKNVEEQGGPASTRQERREGAEESQ